MAKSGSYTHPSYLTRQMIVLGNTTAGNAGTSLVTNFPCDMRLRNVMATVVTAGTATGHKVDIYAGTTSVGSISLGTSAANGTATSGDLNTTITAGSQLYLKNGTDATGVARLVAEMHLDQAATWS